MFGTYRIVLAMMVVLSHLGGIRDMGAFAVFGFYSLSGYLMTLIMHETYGYKGKAFVKFATNRILRIYPLYWISALLSLVLAFHLGERYVMEYHSAMYIPTTFAEVAANLLIVLFPLEAPRLTPPAWALTVELFYYFLIGLGLSRYKSVTVLWVVFSLVYHMVVVKLNLGTQYRYYSVFAASLPFSLGALIFHYRKQIYDGVDKLPKSTRNYIPYVVLVLIGGNWTVNHLTQFDHRVFFYVNLLLCLLMIMILNNQTKIAWISIKLDKWLGDCSYPVYLFHYQSGLLAILILDAFNIDAVRPSLLLLIASIPIVFLLSHLANLIVNRRIEKIRSKVKRI